jgi:MoxR-like ATPase
MNEISKLLGGAVSKAKAGKELEETMDGMTPLERSRAITRGKIKPEKKVPVKPMEPTKEVTRGWLEDVGWDELERAHNESELDRVQESGDKAIPLIVKLEKSEGFKEALVATRQVLNLKPGTATRIKAKEARVIEDFIKWHGMYLVEEAKRKAEAARKSRFDIIEIPGESGPLYFDQTTIKRMVTSVERGRDFLLVGEPGVAKTEAGRALGPLTGRKLFHMEMSGLSDVGQLEAQQYLEEKNGATVTTLKPTPIIEALEAAEAGEQVILFLDEYPRVTDPQIHNPLLLLMSQREFHAQVQKKIYRVKREDFVIVASGNFDAGRNFSGNNRRGVDDASLDRLRVIRVNRPPASVIPFIIESRVDLAGLSMTAATNVLQAARHLYSMADSAEIMRLITPRSVISIVDAWVSLDPKLYSLAETVKLELEHRPGTDTATLDGIVSALELKGI